MTFTSHATPMPSDSSFDIVSELNLQEMDNAITQAQVRSNIVLLLVEQLRRAGDIEIGERSAEDQARVEQERHAELEAARDSATGALDAALTLMRDDLARL